MKKTILCFAIAFLFFNSIVHSATVDRYPVVVTSDTATFTTTVGQFWRWLETRIKLSVAQPIVVRHIFISGTNFNGDDANHNTIIEQTYNYVSTTDTVIYPGVASGDTATVLFRDTDELRIEVNSTSNGTTSGTVYTTVIGEKI